MKIRRFFALICVALLLFSACAAKETSSVQTETKAEEVVTTPPAPTLEPVATKAFNPSEQLIGFVIDKSEGIMSLAAIHGFLRTAEILGYPALLLDCDSPDQAVAKVDEAISAGCTGLLVWANTPELTAAAKKARAAGIKVVIPYFPSDNASADANLAPDPKDYAAEAARIMCEQIKSKKRDSGVIAVIGSEQFPEITDAFVETVMKYYPNYTIGQPNDGDDPAKFVAGNKNLVGVLALKSGSAKQWYDAYRSVVSAEATPKPGATANSKPSVTPKATTSSNVSNSGRIKPVIIALDYTDANTKMVKDGTIFALIARPYYDSTAQSIAVVDRLLRGITTQTQVRLNAPIIRSSGIEKYISIMDEIKEWFDLK